MDLLLNGNESELFQLDLNKAFHSFNNCKHPQITTKYSQKQFYFQPGQFVAKIIF